MPSSVVPLDEGPADRRRVGPFWIEEGTAVVILGIVIVAVVLALYAVAWIERPA